MSKKCDHTDYPEQYLDYKERLLAEEIEISCKACKEVIYKRARVNSSNIFSVGVFGDDLYVEFIQGYPENLRVNLYAYPKQAYHLTKMLKSVSAGEYFSDEIKSVDNFIKVR